jgi:hypothetical protein
MFYAYNTFSGVPKGTFEVAAAPSSTARLRSEHHRQRQLHRQLPHEDGLDDDAGLLFGCARPGRRQPVRATEAARS